MAARRKDCTCALGRQVETLEAISEPSDSDPHFENKCDKNREVGNDSRRYLSGHPIRHEERQHAAEGEWQERDEEDQELAPQKVETV
jgi:hypothetical protein